MFRRQILAVPVALACLGIVLAAALLASSSGTTAQAAGASTDRSGRPVSPSALGMRAAAAADRREREARGARNSARAKAERRRSRTRYRNRSARRARKLFVREFGPAVDPRRADPSGLLHGRKAWRYLGARKAIVDGRRGSLAYSTVDLQADNNASGDPAPVDLTLAETDGGFAPANPNIPLILPETLATPITMGEHGLRVTVETDQNAEGALLPLNAAVFYANASADTDVVLSSHPQGMELSAQLRSPESPENVPFHVDASGPVTTSATPEGGVLVRSDGQTIASIHPPVAFDAQGTPVDVSLELDDDEGGIRMHVDHHGRDLAFPIYADPVFEDWGSSGQSWQEGNGTLLSQWTNYKQDARYSFGFASLAGQSYPWGPVGTKGLYIWAPASGTQYGATIYGEHIWVKPGGPTAWISRTDFLRQWIDRGTQTSDTAIQLFQGLYSYSAGAWVNIAFKAPTTGVAVANYSNTVSAPAGDKRADAVAFGLQFITAHVRTAPLTGYMGGAIIYLEDTTAPSFSATWSGIPANNGWTNGDNIKLSYTATDNGLGLKDVYIAGTGAQGQNPYYNNNCTGRKDRPCTNSPVSQTGASAYAVDKTKLNEGSVQLYSNAHDILNNTSSAVSTSAFRVDKTLPSGSITGISANEALKSGTRSLAFTGTDAASGVSKVRAFLDGDTTPIAQKLDCAGNASCTTPAYTLNTTAAGLPEGAHNITVEVTDVAGNIKPSAARVDFVVDRTAPRVDTNKAFLTEAGGWTGASSTTLRSAFADPESASGAAPSGVQELVVTVDGTVVASAPGCGPTACVAERNIELDLSSVTSGDHLALVRVTDRAGNAVEQSIPLRVDPVGPTLQLSGTAYAPDTHLMAAPSEALDIEVQDGDATDLQSGAAATQVTIDGSVVDTFEQACPGVSSCVLSHSWDLVASTLTPGRHTLRVSATDFAGNESSRQWIVDVPESLGSATCEGSASPGSSPIPAADLEPTSSVIAQIESGASSLLAPSVAATIGGVLVSPGVEVRSEYHATGTLAPAEITSDPDGSIALPTGHSGACFVLESIAVNASGSTLHNDSIVYPNISIGVDAIVRPTAVGVESLLHMREPGSSAAYQFSASLAPGQSLVQTSPTTVAVVAEPTESSTGDAVPEENSVDGPDQPSLLSPMNVDSSSSTVEDPPSTPVQSAAAQRDAVPNVISQVEQAERLISEATDSIEDGKVVAVFAAPWAVDAADVAVPIHLEVRPEGIVLEVQPPPTAEYPIVADPIQASASAVAAARSGSGPYSNGPSPDLNKDVDRRDCPSMPAGAVCGRPDHRDIAAYARRWGPKKVGRNPNYPITFENDCSNFVSQALQAGGVTPMGEWRGDYDKESKSWAAWWAFRDVRPGSGGNVAYTRSWSLAATLKAHLVNWRLGSVTTHFHTGDVIFVNRRNGPPAEDHVAVISGYSDGHWRVAQHTTSYGFMRYVDWLERNRDEAFEIHGERSKWSKVHMRVERTKANITG